MQLLQCFRTTFVPAHGSRKTCRRSLTSYSTDGDSSKGHLPNDDYTYPLQNPLQRLEDLGTRSFGIILEFEAVILPTSLDVERDIWNQLALEESLEQPLDYQIRQAFRRKSEYVISQVFNWSNDPARVRFLSTRKYQIYSQKKFRSSSCAETTLSFLNQLTRSKIRCAVYSSQLSSEELARALTMLQICDLFKTGNFRAGRDSSNIFGRDSFKYGLPDTELYLLMAQVLGQFPMKCIVLSDNHLAIEAARELGMKSIIVSDAARSWELCNADIIVPSLRFVSFRNLQNLFTLDVYD